MCARADKGNGLNKTKYFRGGREFGHRKRQKAEEGEKEHKLTQNIFVNIPSELAENDEASWRINGRWGNPR